MAFQKLIRVIYPLQSGIMVLRTELDWNVNVAPTRVSADGQTFEFAFTTDKSFLYFKPCIVGPNGLTWSPGTNYLAIMSDPADKDIYPYFFGGQRGTISQALRVDSLLLARPYFVRVYFPPGYDENTRKRYPVLYMHDGSNLFFPAEAFLGREWQVDETMAQLDDMNLMDKVIVVGIYAQDRMRDYTAPGYMEYGRFLAEELKPLIDGQLRTLPTARHTAVMGSSLGGVVSLYLVWQWPAVFGKAACLSSTFSYRDDLMARITVEAKREVMIYLDSGWPQDNYEVTRAMGDLLLARAYRFGTDLLYFAFPNARHDESYWAARSHIPFQFFFGKTPVLV